MTLSIHAKFRLALGLVLVPACSEPQSTNPGLGSASGSAALSATASATGGVAGTSSNASSGATTAGGAASSGQSMASSTAAASSVASAGTASASSSTSSAISSASSTSSTSASSTTAAPDASGSDRDAGTADSGEPTDAGNLLALASGFDKFRFECPCEDANHFGLDKSENCDNPATADRQTHSKMLAGDANVVYDVTLHVRGNTEPNTYVNGALDSNQRFYVGGKTSTPGYTAYMLTVADPQEVYFFNYNPSTSHIHFLIDYEVTIPMRGGTTLTFEVNGGDSVPDGHGVSNRDELVVPGIEPAPQPYNGQIVQFDVVSVAPRP